MPPPTAASCAAAGEAVFAQATGTSTIRGTVEDTSGGVLPGATVTIDASLTQHAWHQFASEVGVVMYFRPMTSAKPLGRRNVEFALLNTGSRIDDADAAWNDTFSHPDSAHWLFEGDALKKIEEDARKAAEIAKQKTAVTEAKSKEFVDTCVNKMAKGRVECALKADELDGDNGVAKCDETK